MSTKTTELDFETAIEAWLVDHAGYEQVPSKLFDTELALDQVTLLAFIKGTQEDAYNKLTASYGATSVDASHS